MSGELHPIIEKAFNAAYSKNKPLDCETIKKLREILLQGRVALMQAYKVSQAEYNPVLTEEKELPETILTRCPILGDIKKADFNTFNISTDTLFIDLLSDSGTSKHYPEQTAVLQQWQSDIPSIHTFAYAGLVPRKQLDVIVSRIFGDRFEHYPALQGRVAEYLLLGALVAQGIFSRGDIILSNRPFDTTKGHIEANGMKVKALTRLADPASYWNSDTVFMGNVDLSKAMKEQLDNVKAFLITVTDNGGGGQPVSMGNFKEVVKFAHSHGIIVWVDACRIFENALFIHLFEDGYHERSILDIVQEMLADADIITVSYKKMYAHSGGGILLRKDSSLIEPYIGSVKKHVQEVTTTGYGLGFDAGYSGLTGMEMIEIITGLFEAINPNRIADRILQPIQISAKLKEAYGLPITGGGHAMYVAADQVLPNVKETNCPAEYLNALLITALFARGCGLGNFLYGGRKELGNGRAELTTQVSMDSLRLAIPRGSYSTSLLYEVLSVIGIAYKEKLFQNVDGGLVPDFYEGDGFDHFKVKFKAIKEGEFDRLVSKLNQILRNKLSSLLS